MTEMTPPEIPAHLAVRPIEVSPATIINWIKPEPVSALEQRCMDELRPGDYEVYDEKLLNFLDEAREIFTRSGVSGMLRAGDLICAVYTANGDLVSASAGTYLHCVTAMLPIKYVMHRYWSEPSVGVREGDIFYANEAKYGGIHSPDQMAFMPVYHQGELIAWTAALAHSPEVGAIEPGGMPLFARMPEEEGMKLTPIRIGENYRLRRDMMDMMVNIVSRAPRMHELDTRARVTAADRLRVRLQQMAAERSNDFVRGLLRHLVVKAEKAARQRIARWNDGIYRAVAFTDTIGREPALLRGVITAIKKGDRITFDFTGTTPETPSTYNSFAHGVAAHAAVCIYGYAFHDLPVSNGVLAAFDWVFPQGTIFSASPGTAVSNSPTLNCITLGLLPQLMARLTFDSDSRINIGASNGNTAGSITLAGVNQHGIQLAELDGSTMNTEGHGARTDMDGVDAYGFPWAHAGRAPDVEESEAEFQFLRLFFGLRRDHCGFGQWRGGAGSEMAMAIRHTDFVRWSTRSRNCKITSAVGQFGGYPSAPSLGIFIQNTDVWDRLKRGDADLPTSSIQMLTERAIQGDYTVEHASRGARTAGNGDVIVHLSGAGGGYGDVLKREPARVMEDRRTGLISDWTVRNVYGVVYDEATLDVDEAATQARRTAIRAQRLGRGKRWAAFHEEWNQLRPPPEALKHFGSWPDGKPPAKGIK